MTLTLYGRWETRLFLFGTVGVALTLCFGWIYGDYQTLLTVLAYVTAYGLAWDALYQFLQSYRWDGDWPPLFQAIGGLVEGLMVWGITRLPDLSGIQTPPDFAHFAAHYGTVWLVTFLLSQGLLKVIFPRWRYRGGEWF